MRSDLIFSAADRVPNPFLLCHLVRISSRRFHKSGESMQATINTALGLVMESDSAKRSSTGKSSAAEPAA